MMERLRSSGFLKGTTEIIREQVFMKSRCLGLLFLKLGSSKLYWLKTLKGAQDKHKIFIT